MSYQVSDVGDAPIARRPKPAQNSLSSISRTNPERRIGPIKGDDVKACCIAHFGKVIGSHG
jgi:hypothetical protein